ncbi:bcl-2-like protein 1 isoform X2 [Danio aesculapii]|uniref:bcl-2-like protein 1 isoform X2 n=1 Tax=Danio aesculapii TaxID=1142201 RepID=UPI0024C0B8FE|nr:bcl-2-like protein 1 isoform X2 [Danio aesculapii]
MASDVQFSNNVILRSFADQVERAGRSVPSLPEPQPMNDDQDEQLLDQIAGVIVLIGDLVDQDQTIKNLIDRFACVLDRQHFQRLAGKVFHDGITWGKIASLICIVGKAIVKIIGGSIPDFVSWTLNYFKDNLQTWICSMGGWINSISSLARFSLELDLGSSSSLIWSSSGLPFISGVLLGGFIVWSLIRRA